MKSFFETKKNSYIKSIPPQSLLIKEGFDSIPIGDNHSLYEKERKEFWENRKINQSKPKDISLLLNFVLFLFSLDYKLWIRNYLIIKFFRFLSKKNIFLQIVWSNNKSLPTTKSLGLGYTNQFEDFTYRLKFVHVENNVNKKTFSKDLNFILLP